MTRAPAVGAKVRGVRLPLPASVALSLAAVCALWLAVGSSPAAAFTPNDLSLRATYNVDAFVHWSNGALSVSSTATVTNTTGGNLSALTFNLVTLQTGHAHVSDVEVNGTATQWTASGQTLVVTLPHKLPPHDQARVRIDYDATFNATSGGGHGWLLIKRDGIAAAYRWIPWLSRKQAFDTPNFGETWVTGVSPRVTVTIDSDAALIYATNGARTGSGANGQTFVAKNVRDFNFSASPNYSVKTVTHHGITVRFYSQGQMAAQIQTWTLAAIDRFDDRIGAYPYSRLTVAMTPGGTGMESPGMTWISTTEPSSNLSYLAAHEVAHQWFYGAVGNNQAIEPFLDEGVSDFLARDTLNSFRKSRCDQARLDRTTYDYSGSCYNEVVYVQSSQYIDAYRDKVGSTKFWSGMSAFYRKYKFRIADTRAFWDALDAKTGYNSQLHADRFPSLYP